MRVIAGEAKGRRLKGPPSIETRPMADKIKEALFSSLGSLADEPDTVLDLYAGTGGVGIEALSRSATWADFVEQSPAACAVIRANLDATNFAKISQVHQIPVSVFLKRAPGAGRVYDLVILDPPYADPAIVATLARVAPSRLVQSGSIVAFGHWPKLALPERIGRMVQLRSRCHGDSCFSVYEITDEEPGAETGDTETPEGRADETRDLSR